MMQEREPKPGRPDTAGLVPCPHCQESISGNASVCPRCRTSTLVDLLVERGVSDPKLRYRAARVVAGFRAGASLANLQAVLGVSGARALSGVTPGVAAACAESLGSIGVATTLVMTTAGSPADAGGWKAPRPLTIVGALAVLLAVYLLWPKEKAPTSADTRAGKAAAAEGRAAGPVLAGAELAQRGLASTVVLRCEESIGSGFFVTQNRVLTNAHVLCRAGEALQVRTSDGRQGTGRVIQAKQDTDLALVQVEGLAGVPLTLGDAGQLRVGDRVVVVGAPRGMEFSVTQGGISSMDRVMLGVAYLQTDAAINPGNSGGPMLDDRGRVVGVVSLKRIDAEGIALVLPINYAFTGADALLGPPLGEPSQSFARMAASAEALSQQEVSRLATTGQRPGLVHASVVGGSIRAVLLWPSAFDPGDQRFGFVLWNRQERLCSLEGELKGWRKVEGEGGESLLSGQGKAWLEKHGFSSDLYAATALLDYSQCSLGSVGPGSTVDLELEGADSDASRIRLQ